jgi:diguanylate cyclase (GGDEF)-like protein
MGGEEFLLVLADTDLPTSTHHLENVRRRIQEHPWAPLTGSLPVTVSIGATARGAADQLTIPELLGRADAHLYRAKRLGRNRLITDRG